MCLQKKVFSIFLALLISSLSDELKAKSFHWKRKKKKRENFFLSVKTVHSLKSLLSPSLVTHDGRRDNAMARNGWDYKNRWFIKSTPSCCSKASADYSRLFATLIYTEIRPQLLRLLCTNNVLCLFIYSQHTLNSIIG